MFNRIVNYTGIRDIDAAVKYISETVAPLMRQQNGFRGTNVSVDRARGILGVLSRWETAADLEASEGASIKVRDQMFDIAGGEATVEHFEEAVTEMAGLPGAGSSLLIRRVTMDPEKIDDNLEYFKRDVVPQIKSQPGFLALRHMVNRETGEGVVGTAWRDEDSMAAASEAANARSKVAADHGVGFGEESRREILFVDMPEPGR